VLLNFNFDLSFLGRRWRTVRENGIENAGWHVEMGECSCFGNEKLSKDARSIYAANTEFPRAADP
jgi:hypothetical protein